VEVNRLTCVAEVKLLLSESLPFSGGERMGVVLDDVGAVGLSEHRQKDSVNLERLLLVVKMGARLRGEHVTENDKGAEGAFREYAQA
jgi:hypothetical protein